MYVLVCRSATLSDSTNFAPFQIGSGPHEPFSISRVRSRVSINNKRQVRCNYRQCRQWHRKLDAARARPSQLPTDVPTRKIVQSRCQIADGRNCMTLDPEAYIAYVVCTQPNGKRLQSPRLIRQLAPELAGSPSNESKVQRRRGFPMADSGFVGWNCGVLYRAQR